MSAPAPLLPAAAERALSDRQREILDALEALAVHEGFARLTMAQLAARVNCSLRTLYGLAPRKDALLLMVIVPFFVTYLPIAGHHPYATTTRGPFTDPGELGAYKNALLEADRSVAALLDGLRERGLDRRTLVVVFGDHGEAFGQHPGNFGHTQFIYEENVRVPLIVAGLTDDASARRVRRIRGGSQYAASSSTSRVWRLTSVDAPPMIPARPIAPSASAIATTSSSRLRSSSSRVTRRSPARARRTIRAEPRRVAASYACIGWLSSSMT